MELIALAQCRRCKNRLECPKHKVLEHVKTDDGLNEFIAKISKGHINDIPEDILRAHHDFINNIDYERLEQEHSPN